VTGLRGARVLVTRPEPEGVGLGALLAAAGAEPIAIPVIGLAPLLGPAEMAELRAAVREGRYDIIAFTSANAVRLLELERSAGSGSELFAIGPGTAAAARRLGWTPRPLPQEYLAESLAEAMVAFGVRGRSVLLPRAEGARAVLPRVLEEAGAEVTEVALYRAVADRASAPRLRQLLLDAPPDWVTFTSSSTVRGYAELAHGRGLPPGSRVACIGPVTARTAESLGLGPGVVARVHSLPGLVAAMEAAPGDDNTR
jgi:uroporphyrinogen-III synthase